MKSLKLNRSVYWFLNITIIISGLFFLNGIVTYLTKLLNILIEILSVGERSQEFNLILVCVMIYLTCTIITVIANIIFKLQSLLEIKEEKK